MTKILTRMAIKTKEQIRVNLENTKSPSRAKPLDLLFNIYYLFFYNTENRGGISSPYSPTISFLALKA